MLTQTQDPNEPQQKIERERERERWGWGVEYFKRGWRLSELSPDYGSVSHVSFFTTRQLTKGLSDSVDFQFDFLYNFQRIYKTCLFY